MSFRSLLLGAALLTFASIAVAPTASADSIAEARARIESSLTVTGTIRIDAGGHVLGYTLDQPEHVPKGIASMIERLAPTWTFEPVVLPANGITESRMSLLFVAKKRDEGVHVALRSASFEADLPENERVTIARRGRLPVYPESMADISVSGTVHLVLQIGRDGKVMNIDASHVNLRTVGTEAEMEEWRREFAEASIRAVRGWTFAPPTGGEAADAPHWIGALVVEYTMDNHVRPDPTHWQTYVPGPKKVLPWVEGSGLLAGNSDALSPGGFHMAGRDRRLLTPLGTL